MTDIHKAMQKFSEVNQEIEEALRQALAQPEQGNSSPNYPITESNTLLKVFFVFYQEKDFAGHVGGSVWDGMYDSKEKALARLDELSKLEWFDFGDYEEFEVK